MDRIEMCMWRPSSSPKDSERETTMKFDDLTPEQQEKARAAKTPEGILALAREEGYELSDDELGAVSGGWDHCSQEKYGCGMVGH